MFKVFGRSYGFARRMKSWFFFYVDFLTGCSNIEPANIHPDIKIYQIYYNEGSQLQLDRQFTPYLNTHCTKYFSDQVAIELYDAGLMDECDYFGIVSWRLWQKIRRGDIRAQIYADNKAHDFYYFTRRLPGIKQKQLWQQANFLHSTDLTSYIQMLLSELGFNVDLLKMDLVPAYFSYQICKTMLYQDYIETLLKPMIALMEDTSRPDLQAWLNQDANYERYGNALTKERLREITGFPYYTKHTFITERLFATYAALKGWKGKVISL